MISGIRPAVQILKTENDRSRVIQSFAGTDRLRSAQNFAGIDHLRAAQDLAGIHPLRVLHRFSDINPANSVRNMNESDPEMIHIPDLAGAVKNLEFLAEQIYKQYHPQRQPLTQKMQVHQAQEHH